MTGRIVFTKPGKGQVLVIGFDADLRTGPRTERGYVEVIDAKLKWSVQPPAASERGP